jgi:hypothetical protein
MKVTDDAIFARLSADNGAGGIVSLVGTKIYRDGSVPPDDPDNPVANYPRIHYGQAAGTPQYTYKAKDHIRTVQLIKGVDSGLSSAVLNAINDRLEALFTLLNAETIAAAGATIIYSRRVRDVEYGEVDGDLRYQHLGGEWEMILA